MIIPEELKTCEFLLDYQYIERTKINLKLNQFILPKIALKNDVNDIQIKPIQSIQESDSLLLTKVKDNEEISILSKKNKENLVNSDEKTSKENETNTVCTQLIEESSEVKFQNLDKQLFYVGFSQGNSKCICSRIIEKNCVKINPFRYCSDNLIVNQKTKYHEQCFIKNNPDANFNW
jgi:hypothetical protein